VTSKLKETTKIQFGPQDCLVDVELFLRVDSYMNHFGQIFPEILVDFNKLLEALVFHENTFIITHNFDSYRVGSILGSFLERGVVKNIDPYAMGNLVNFSKLKTLIDQENCVAMQIDWQEAITYFDSVRDDDRFIINFFVRNELNEKEKSLYFGAYPYFCDRIIKLSENKIITKNVIKVVISETLEKFGDVVGTRYLKRAAIMSALSLFLGLQYESDIGHSILDAFSCPVNKVSPYLDYTYLKNEFTKFIEELIQQRLFFEIPIPPLTIVLFDRLHKAQADKNKKFYLPINIVEEIDRLRAETKEYRETLSAYMEKIKNPGKFSIAEIKDAKEQTIDNCMNVLRKIKFKNIDSALFRDIVFVAARDEAPETLGGLFKFGYKTYKDIKIMLKNRWVFQLNNALANLQLKPNMLVDLFPNSDPVNLSFKKYKKIENITNNINRLNLNT